MLWNKRQLFGLLMIVMMSACATNSIGSLEGSIISGSESSSVKINFSAIRFPDTGSDNTFSIELSNVSGDGITFLISAKNTEATTLAERFPIGIYLIDGTGNQLTGSITALGSESVSITGTNRSGNSFLQLTAFQIGTDASSGQPAVAQITGNFDVDLLGVDDGDGGFVVGDFEKNFID